MSAPKRPGNTQLAWMLAGVVVAVFILALWKFRPL